MNTMYRLKIKEFRKLKGLTQKELALKVGISQNFLSEIENCKYDISLALFCRISIALEVSPYELIDFSFISKDNFFYP
jgi:transcriptional regulator with XRE-family HTH domain